MSTKYRRIILVENGWPIVPIHRDTKSPKGYAALDWTTKLRIDAYHYIDTPPDDDGVLCDGLRVIDIDIDDPGRAQAMIDYIEQQHGSDLLYRCRAGSPRRLYPFRAAEGEPPKRYVVNDGERVEVLGHGQQFYAHGLHPSGSPLEWSRGGLLANSRLDVPAITEAQVTALLTFAASVIGSAAPRDHSRQPRPERVLNSEAWLLGDLKAALNEVPCPPDYDAWFRLSCAVFDACGGSPDGELAWHAWCARGRGYSKVAADRLWDSLYESPTYYSAGTLLYEVRLNDPQWQWPSRTMFTPIKLFS